MLLIYALTNKVFFSYKFDVESLDWSYIGLFQMFLLKLWIESGIENIGPICYTRLIFRPAIGAYYDRR